MGESGKALVMGLGITKGLKVLDLGCGDGTTAIPEAVAGAEVLGVDIARNLVEAGNKRAKQLGLTNCRFQEGDASNLELRNCFFKKLWTAAFESSRYGVTGSPVAYGPCPTTASNRAMKRVQARHLFTTPARLAIPTDRGGVPRRAEPRVHGGGACPSLVPHREPHRKEASSCHTVSGPQGREAARFGTR